MATFHDQGQNGYVNSASGYNQPGIHVSYAAAQLSVDSLPPSGLRDWRTDVPDADDAYAPSASASPAMFRPINYFDSFFNQANPVPQPPPLASPGTVTNWNGGIPHDASPSCVPPSTVNDPFAMMAEDEDDNSETTDSTFHRNGSLSSQTGDSPRTPPRTPRKGAWGSSKEARPPSNPGRHSSRIKAEPSSNKSSSFSSSKGRRLRDVKRPRTKLPAEDTEIIPSSRSSHNMIEKQYRNRLNSQFSSLLDALPMHIVSVETNAYISERDSKVSKGEVLVFARRYIQDLEQGMKEMEGVIDSLKAQCVRTGGDPPL